MLLAEISRLEEQADSLAGVSRLTTPSFSTAHIHRLQPTNTITSPEVVSTDDTEDTRPHTRNEERESASILQSVLIPRKRFAKVRQSQTGDSVYYDLPHSPTTRAKKYSRISSEDDVDDSLGSEDSESAESELMSSDHGTTSRRRRFIVRTLGDQSTKTAQWSTSSGNRDIVAEIEARYAGLTPEDLDRGEELVSREKISINGNITSVPRESSLETATIDDDGESLGSTDSKTSGSEDSEDLNEYEDESDEESDDGGSAVYETDHTQDVLGKDADDARMEDSSHLGPLHADVMVIDNPESQQEVDSKLSAQANPPHPLSPLRDDTPPPDLRDDLPAPPDSTSILFGCVPGHFPTAFGNSSDEGDGSWSFGRLKRKPQQHTDGTEEQLLQTVRAQRLVRRMLIDPPLRFSDDEGDGSAPDEEDLNGPFAIWAPYVGEQSAPALAFSTAKDLVGTRGDASVFEFPSDLINLHTSHPTNPLFEPSTLQPFLRDRLWPGTSRTRRKGLLHTLSDRIQKHESFLDEKSFDPKRPRVLPHGTYGRRFIGCEDGDAEISTEDEDEDEEEEEDSEIEETVREMEEWKNSQARKEERQAKKLAGQAKNDSALVSDSDSETIDIGVRRPRRISMVVHPSRRACLRPEEVSTIIDAVVEEIRYRFDAITKPGILAKAFKIWVRQQGTSSKKRDHLKHLMENRLPALKSQLSLTQWSSEAELRRRCGILEVTCTEIHTLQVLIEILEGPQPAKPDTVELTAENVTTNLPRHADGSSDTDEESWSDFIDDDEQQWGNYAKREARRLNRGIKEAEKDHLGEPKEASCGEINSPDAESCDQINDEPPHVGMMNSSDSSQPQSIAEDVSIELEASVDVGATASAAGNSNEQQRIDPTQTPGPNRSLKRRRVTEDSEVGSHSPPTSDDKLRDREALSAAASQFSSDPSVLRLLLQYSENPQEHPDDYTTSDSSFRFDEDWVLDFIQFTVVGIRSSQTSYQENASSWKKILRNKRSRSSNDNDDDGVDAMDQESFKQNRVPEPSPSDSDAGFESPIEISSDEAESINGEDEGLDVDDEEYECRKGKGKGPMQNPIAKENAKRLNEQNQAYSELEKRAAMLRTNNGSDHVVVNAGHDEYQEDIKVGPGLARWLKNHQVDGIQFLWKSLIAFRMGCILAHAMGLGKTLQIVVFVATVLREVRRRNPILPPELSDGRVLILMPASLVRNWYGRTSLGYGLGNSEKAGKRKLGEYMFTATKLNEGLSQMKTKFRVCLTGTPLQNNLEEYYHMIEFVNPGFLGPKNEFMSSYGKPIEEGAFGDAEASKKRKATICMKALQRDIGPFIQRFEQSRIAHHLPAKTDYVVSIRLTPAQRILYLKLLAHVKAAGTSLSTSVLSLDHIAVKLKLERIKDQTFPKMLTTKDVLAGEALAVEGENLIRSVNDVAEHAPTNINNTEEGETIAYLNAMSTECDHVFQEYGDDLTLSYKALVVLEIVKRAIENDEKTLIFSNYIPTVDFLEKLLLKNDILNARLDGQVPQRKRQTLVDLFNTSKEIPVFLLTPKTGGLGLNLIGASRVVICDYHWNPIYGEQAVARAYRFGQTKHVFVYRLYIEDSIDKRLLDNNVRKTGISMNVVDKRKVQATVTNESLRAYLRPPEENQSPAMPSNGRLVTDPIMKGVIEKFDHGILDVKTIESLRVEEPELDAEEERQQNHEIEEIRARAEWARRLRPSTSNPVLR
ncbi:hypothetical protein HDU93_008713 [Gonapodya sp. JEL0774]|nr:hypothetical protein HDU93_008713 [Gonapodya sp. JEL0774]